LIGASMLASAHARLVHDTCASLQVHVLQPSPAGNVVPDA
jgi:hypothetical protein